MKEHKHKPAAPNTPQADPFCARQIQRGLTLVPYRARNGQGEWMWCSAWVRLQPGESVSAAASRCTGLG